MLLLIQVRSILLSGFENGRRQASVSIIRSGLSLFLANATLEIQLWPNIYTERMGFSSVLMCKFSWFVITTKCKASRYLLLLSSPIFLGGNEDFFVIILHN